MLDYPPAHPYPLTQRLDPMSAARESSTPLQSLDAKALDASVRDPDMPLGVPQRGPGVDARVHITAITEAWIA